MATRTLSLIATAPWRSRNQADSRRILPSRTQGATVIDMADLTHVVNNDLASPPPASSNPTSLSNRDNETGVLFGPNLGFVNSGPNWTKADQPKVVSDTLTLDTVKLWIAKSKEASHATTVLQALVNLKRPTLRLSPLSIADDPSDPSHMDSHHLHGLEFEFDCDAPKCGIYVSVFLHPDHPESDKAVPTAAGSLCKTLVFEQVVDGGFGRILRLEEGAALELGKFEHHPKQPKKTTTAATTTTASEAAASQEQSESVPAAELPTSPGPDTLGVPATTSAASAEERRKRRFTPFHFRKRMQGRAVTGPALAVVDMDPAPSAVADGADGAASADNGAGPPAMPAAKPMGNGVKIVIRLVALGEDSMELANANEQKTYLHIVRYGPVIHRPDSQDDGEDARPWVVEVVKREATIGNLTFHLHEIYGLSSSVSSCPAPTACPAPPASAPIPAIAHSYPPAPPLSAPSPPSPQGASSECVVCLSSAREVVLLPCRHLVACKECALNMVEFGAGGTIAQASEAETSMAGAAAAAASTSRAGAAGGGGQEGPAPGTDAVPIAPGTTAPPNQRRKRRPKGWFCPICRSSYTSLLRLTTAPPEMPHSHHHEEGSISKKETAPKVEPETSTLNVMTATTTATTVTIPTTPTAPMTPTISASPPTPPSPALTVSVTPTEQSSAGARPGIPGFLRSLSSRATGSVPEVDLERDAGGT